MHCRSECSSCGHYISRRNKPGGTHLKCHILAWRTLESCLHRSFLRVQPGLYNLHHSLVHCLDVFLESDNGRKFVGDLVMVLPPIIQTATIANPSTTGAAARLALNSKRRPHER